VCQHIIPAINDNKKTAPSDIVSEIRRNEGTQIPYMAAWRGKQKAFASINAEEATDYKKIPSYVAKINEDGGHAVSEYNSLKRFVRVFVALSSTRECYKHTLKFIGLDGTHLKAKYLGMLLLAVTLDANSEIVILAYAIVNSENEANWRWFLQHLKTAYPGINTENTTIISDREKGLIEGVRDELYQAIHSLCVRHLAANFQVRFKSTELTKLLWKAAYAPIENLHKKIMDEIRAKSPQAADYLEDSKPELWALALCQGVKYGHITSNIAESINSVLLDVRELPAIQVLLGIHEYTMTKFFDRRTKAAGLTGTLVRSVSKEVSANIKSGRSLSVHPSDRNSGLVSKREGGHEIVKVYSKECTCGKFQISCVPCHHACAFLLHLRINPEDEADPLFRLDNYKATYSHSVLPVRLEDLEDDHEKLPPITTRPRGRPKKSRIRHRSEVGDKRQNTCSRCGGKGHSRKTCKAPIQ
jgi:hypothetical protein